VTDRLTRTRVSKLLQKSSPFPYTEYLEECCLALRERLEYPTDNHIYYLVQSQHIMDSIENVTMTNSGKSGEASITRIQTQLHELGTYLNINFSASSKYTYSGRIHYRLLKKPSLEDLIQIQFSTTELFLCQAAFFDKTAPLHISFHVDILRMGLIAAKNIFTLYLSLPIYADKAFNNSEWIQLSFALTVAARLTTASNHNSVNHLTKDLRQSLDLPNILRRVSSRIGALSTRHVDAVGNRDVFYYYEERVRRIHSWFEHLSATENMASVVPSRATIVAHSKMLPAGSNSQTPTSETAENELVSTPLLVPQDSEHTLDPGGWANSVQPGQLDIQLSELFPELEDFVWSSYSPFDS
jgi:hypothetical protein